MRHYFQCNARVPMIKRFLATQFVLIVERSECSGMLVKYLSTLQNLIKINCPKCGHGFLKIWQIIENLVKNCKNLFQNKVNKPLKCTYFLSLNQFKKTVDIKFQNQEFKASSFIRNYVCSETRIYLKLLQKNDLQSSFFIFHGLLVSFICRQQIVSRKMLQLREEICIVFSPILQLRFEGFFRIWDSREK